MTTPTRRVSDRARFRQPAKWLARDIEAGAFVNLGIGLPSLVREFLKPEQHIFIQSENGVLGLGPEALAGKIDPDLIDPGKRPATLVPGASIADHVASFEMIRGGHLDLAVLGAFQVSASGDFASWSDGGVPAVGGAMDLAAGAKHVWIFMSHYDHSGKPKLVAECTLPLTGIGVVGRIYTEIGIFRPNGAGFDTIWSTEQKIVKQSRRQVPESPPKPLPARAINTGTGGD